MKFSEDDNKKSTVQDFSLTATHLLEYLFCPRFIYFENVLDIPERQEKRFKVRKGRAIHEQVKKRNPGYLRKKLDVKSTQSDVYLSNDKMRGVIDEIIFMGDGSAAPIDYKYAVYKERTFRNHKFQLVFYGKLIQDNYGAPVKRGFIVYTRSKNKLVEVAITPKLYDELNNIISNLIDIIQKGYYPNPTKYKARCQDCCYRNICEQNV